MENTFTTYANQRKIVINRVMPSGTKEAYLCAYMKNIEAAAQNLKGEVAFKVYIYLLGNGNNFGVWFSPELIAKRYGVSADRIRKCFKELVEKGYLIEEGHNLYQFYEVPQKKTVIHLGEEEKRYIPTDEGEVLMTYAALYKELKDDYPADFISNFWSECRKEDD